MFRYNSLFCFDKIGVKADCALSVLVFFLLQILIG